jgi:eukaryotic-like serine/threonine-protein kinase
VWAEAFEPVRGKLLPSLLKRYLESRVKIESGSLPLTELAAEATTFDLCASLLARYSHDRPVELAEVAMIADGRHLPLFIGSIVANLVAVAPRLEAELTRTTFADRPASDLARETIAKRQASAAVVLLRLGQSAKVWPLLKHSPDPRVRSYLIHKLFPLGADATALIRRLEEEENQSSRHALILALGEYTGAMLPGECSTSLLPKIQGVYLHAPDPGVHAAAEWLLRQWKQDEWLREQNQAWAATSRPASAPGVFPAAAGKNLAELNTPQWYVNTQGQNFVSIPGPVKFVMGSPLSEKDREDYEAMHTRRIGRSYAITSKFVTLAQYRNLTKADYLINEKYTYDPDLPVVAVDWYMAARYCNLLSKTEGIPADQWCYDVQGPKEIVKPKANYLSLTGYRLPTEAEVEYVTRAGATTSRYYGETDELLPYYAWYSKNSAGQLHPVGLKKPNDLGLFDALGNCHTWCQEPFGDYPAIGLDGLAEDTEVDRSKLDIVVSSGRVLRGGQFFMLPSLVRSASRNSDVPSSRNLTFGFRMARTLIP